MIKFICKNCGTEFYDYLRKNRPRIFCSKRCVLKYQHQHGIGCASKESKEKLSHASKINPNRYWLGKSEEFKRKFPNCGKHMIGKKASQKTKEKKSKIFRGVGNPNWQGGKTTINQQIRASLPYRQWRESVFERDDFTCRICNSRGGKLHTDHIKPFFSYPELRFDVENGRTLCANCHKETDTYLNKRKRIAV